MEPGALPASQVPVFERDTKPSHLGLDILKYSSESSKDYSQVLGDSGFCKCLRECRQSLGKDPALPFSLVAFVTSWLHHLASMRL